MEVNIERKKCRVMRKEWGLKITKCKVSTYHQDEKAEQKGEINIIYNLLWNVQVNSSRDGGLLETLFCLYFGYIRTVGTYSRC